MSEEDLKLLPRGLLTMLGLTLLVFCVAFFSVADSYFHYRPQIAGTDEISARIASLVGQACVAVAGLLLWKTAAYPRFRVFRYLAVLAGLAVLLVFLGLRALALASLCVVTFACYKARWLSLGQRAFVGVFYFCVVAGSSVVMYQTNSLANKNGKEVVGGVVKLAEAGAPETCSENLKKSNSVAIRLELFGDAMRQFRSSPIVGVGAGAFGQHSCWSSAVAHPHNVLMQALSELGILGAGILVAAFVFAVTPQVRTSWQPHDVRNLAFLFFLFASLNSLSSGNYFTSIELWWSLGLIVSMNSRGVRRISWK